MLLTQKFHSLQEIDPEFIPAVESLMQEHWASFQAWKEAEAKAPQDETFNYWLFFGPTQNTPIGIAQASLKKIEADQYLPWWKKMTSVFDKSLEQWKIARFQLGGGTDGCAIFDPRFARTGREKLLEVIKEVESRKDVMALTVLFNPGMPNYKPTWPEIFHEAQHQWQVLKPWSRTHKAYQDYLASLPADDAKSIQQNWRHLHKDVKVTLGDYPTIASREELFATNPGFDRTVVHDYAGGLLTFQKDGNVLGLVKYHTGQQGTLFVEPQPLEPQGQELVGDALYVQYALLKAHEIADARRVVLIRHGEVFRIDSKAEVEFFKAQGFSTTEITERDWSRSEYLK